MRFGVLGRGFGLYGWLPALAKLSNVEIRTLARYRPTLEARPELHCLIPRITFFAELEQLLNDATHLVIARRPQDQSAVVNDLVGRGWTGCVFLEKPLAADPSAARASVERLDVARIRVGNSFIMNEASWALALATVLQKTEPIAIKIDWRFMAHHYVHPSTQWKRKRCEGGGALRFYGIHLIEWLVQRGHWTAVACSPPDPSGDDPAVTFTVSEGNRSVSVTCDSQWAGAPTFEISCTSNQSDVMRLACSDPFDEPPFASLPQPLEDRRVPFLHRLLERSISQGGDAAASLEPHLRLWSQIEDLRNSAA